MPLDSISARHYASACLLIPGFPNDETALDWLSLVIMRDCPDESAADELVMAMIETFDRWPGVGKCKRLFRILQTGHAIESLPLRKAPTDLCPACASNGTINIDGGGFARCPCCKAGEEYPQNLLDMINEQANRPRPRQQIEAQLKKAIELDRSFRASEYTGPRGE